MSQTIVIIVASLIWLAFAWMIFKSIREEIANTKIRKAILEALDGGDHNKIIILLTQFSLLGLREFNIEINEYGLNNTKDQKIIIDAIGKEFLNRKRK